MNKTIKFITMLCIILTIVAVASSVFALDPSTIKGDVTGNGAQQIQNVGQRIIGIIQVVGSVLAVAMLVVIGIKYMLGSAEDKAEYKKSLMPYLIGAILIFAASNLAGVIYSFAGNLSA